VRSETEPHRLTEEATKYAPSHGQGPIVMDEDSAEELYAPKPYLTRIRLALAPYSVHFQNPGYIKDETMRMLERDVVKTTLEETRRNFELRYADLRQSFVI
jgi:hypothetical protein